MQFLYALALGWCLLLMGVSMSAEKDCLEKGYPESKVDYLFNSYCVTIDGTTKAVVDKR